MIELSSFPECWTQHQRGIISEVADVALGCHNDIFGEAEPLQAGIDGLSSPPSVNSVRHDHEEVEVTVRSHPSSCRRSEQHDSLRTNCLDDAVHDLVENLRF